MSTQSAEVFLKEARKQLTKSIKKIVLKNNGRISVPGELQIIYGYSHPYFDTLFLNELVFKDQDIFLVGTWDNDPESPYEIPISEVMFVEILQYILDQINK